MWEQMEKPKTVVSTKALVKEFMEMEPAPYDRPLSEKRLQVYQRILQAGEFRPCTWASAFCEETSATYRVNGKHTSVMLSGLDKLPEFFVTVERYRCSTLDDVAKLYGTFDSRLGSRTAHDINLAFAATMKELAGIKHKIFHLVVTAASFAKWGADYLVTPPAERAELLLDNGEFAVWLSDIVFPKEGNRNPKHINRAAVVNAIFSSYNRAKTASAEFWSLVRDEAHPDRNNASRTLARYLIRTSVNVGMGSNRKGKEVATSREIYAKCIQGWNAWRRNEKTDLKYYAQAKLPGAV